VLDLEDVEQLDLVDRAVAADGNREEPFSVLRAAS
jgi:hypothetical protein